MTVCIWCQYSGRKGGHGRHPGQDLASHRRNRRRLGTWPMTKGFICSQICSRVPDTGVIWIFSSVFYLPVVIIIYIRNVFAETARRRFETLNSVSVVYSENILCLERVISCIGSIFCLINVMLCNDHHISINKYPRDCRVPVHARLAFNCFFHLFTRCQTFSYCKAWQLITVQIVNYIIRALSMV